MLKIDGHHARGPRALRQRRRDLQNAQSAYEVHMEGWAERVAHIAHAMDFATCFAQQRIIHGRDQWLGLVQVAFDNGAHPIQDGLIVESVL